MRGERTRLTCYMYTLTGQRKRGTLVDQECHLKGNTMPLTFCAWETYGRTLRHETLLISSSLYTIHIPHGNHSIVRDDSYTRSIRMIFTLFLLPALLPANAIVLPLEPHWTSLKPATTGFIQARNRPPPGFVAEDGQGGHGGSAAPNDHVVNAVAAGSSQGDDEEYECEEWEEDADTAAPNDRTVVNTAATGSSMDEEGDECDEEEEEGGAEHPPNDQTVVNAAATGSSMDEGGDECHEEEEEGGAEPAQNDQTVVNTAATGSSMDEDRDECDEEEEGGAEQAPNETMAVNAVATGSSRGGEGSNGGSPNPAGGQGSGPSGGQGGGPPGEGRPPDSGES